jgi:hypothetical protein
LEESAGSPNLPPVRDEDPTVKLIPRNQLVPPMRFGAVFQPAVCDALAVAVINGVQHTRRSGFDPQSCGPRPIAKIVILIAPAPL